jgi:hypothetical protein
MVISMRPQMGMSIRIPGAVGTRPRELPIIRQATRGRTLRLLTAMEGRKGAAEHRLLEAAAEEGAGNPGKRVLVVRQVAVVAAAGAVAGSQDASGEATLRKQ